MQFRMLAPLLGVALVLLIGAARAQETGKVPDFVPSDHWEASLQDGNATVASPTRDATILIGCSEGDPSIALIVTLTRPVAMNEQFRTVTLKFDDKPPVSQSWFSTRDSYGLADDELAFITTVEGLTHHRSVEFVLSENGKELDRHSFTLNGAAEAINAVVRACHKSG
jgi:hypothetical protein